MSVQTCPEGKISLAEISWVNDNVPLDKKVRNQWSTVGNARRATKDSARNTTFLLCKYIYDTRPTGQSKPPETISES